MFCINCFVDEADLLERNVVVSYDDAAQEIVSNSFNLFKELLQNCHELLLKFAVFTILSSKFLSLTEILWFSSSLWKVLYILSTSILYAPRRKICKDVLWFILLFSVVDSSESDNVEVLK